MVDFSNIHPSFFTRKIIHIDMDAFYAAVEVRENPQLQGKPIIVGGRPNGRGVVSTASYEARKFGIHSAMPAARAARLCPQAIFLKPNFERCKEASRQIRMIMREVTDLVEPLSLDEAYLDVTAAARNTSATDLAKALRAKIYEQTRLTASAGVAPNKMLAKVASDLNKPDGLSVIRPAEVAAFMRRLPVRKIPGIGPVSAKKLANLGINTCGDVEYFTETLLSHWGKFGRWLLHRAQGIDERPVQTSWVRKSLGHETTFARDLDDKTELQNKISELAKHVGRRLDKAGVSGRTVTLKVKYANFDQITRCRTLASHTRDVHTITDICTSLLDLTDAGNRRNVRLLGISLSNLQDGKQPYQPSFCFD